MKPKAAQSPQSASPDITISCSELRRHLGRYLVLVQTESARITVARYGRPAAVLESLEASAAGDSLSATS